MFVRMKNHRKEVPEKSYAVRVNECPVLKGKMLEILTEQLRKCKQLYHMQNHSISKNSKGSSSQLSSSTANNFTIKANGETRYPTAREKFTSQMDITSKAISMKEKRNPATVYLFLMMDPITEEMWLIQSSLERVALCRSLELYMKEIGSGINLKDSGRRFSVMAIRMKGVLLMG